MLLVSNAESVSKYSPSKATFVHVLALIVCAELRYAEKAGLLVKGPDTVSPASPIVIDEPDCFIISFTFNCDTTTYSLSLRVCFFDRFNSSLPIIK